MYRYVAIANCDNQQSTLLHTFVYATRQEYTNVLASEQDHLKLSHVRTRSRYLAQLYQKEQIMEVSRAHRPPPPRQHRSCPQGRQTDRSNIQHAPCLKQKDLRVCIDRQEITTTPRCHLPRHNDRSGHNNHRPATHTAPTAYPAPQPPITYHRSGTNKNHADHACCMNAPLHPC